MGIFHVCLILKITSMVIENYSQTASTALNGDLSNRRVTEAHLLLSVFSFIHRLEQPCTATPMYELNKHLERLGEQFL